LGKACCGAGLVELRGVRKARGEAAGAACRWRWRADRVKVGKKEALRASKILKAERQKTKTDEGGAPRDCP
jgi:hypothetical protein